MTTRWRYLSQSKQAQIFAVNARLDANRDRTTSSKVLCDEALCWPHFIINGQRQPTASRGDISHLPTSMPHQNRRRSLFNYTAPVLTTFNRVVQNNLICSEWSEHIWELEIWCRIYQPTTGRWVLPSFSLGSTFLKSLFNKQESDICACFSPAPVLALISIESRGGGGAFLLQGRAQGPSSARTWQATNFFNAAISRVNLAFFFGFR